MHSSDAEPKGGSAPSESRPDKKKKSRILLEVGGSLAAAAIGLYVYKVSGLYDSADSGLVHLAIGGAIVMWLILNVRIALHQKK